jgi:hypothetical protein
MSTTTTRNSLTKPGYADAADIAVINTDLDTIDAAIAKCNYAATSAPTANEDSGKGYAVGSVWIDVTNHKVYVCEVNTLTAAVWRQVYPSDLTGAVLANGTVPLTANWDVGAYKITANQLASDVADGTAPLVITSKTVTSNLNADMLDGLHDTSFVKQTLADAKGDIIAASAADTWTKVTVSSDGHSLVGDASATAGVSWQPIYSGESRNLLINPEFMINQTGIAQYQSTTNPANSDDTYLLDQWILLSDGNDIMDVWRSTAVYPSAQYGTGNGASILLQTETANKKAGILQIIPNQTARRVVNGVVSLRFSAYTMASYPNANIMAAVISWSGTADVVTSDVVSAWEATNTAPTLVANWTYENVPARLALVNDSWTEYKIENIAIDTASTTNIAVFIWLDDTDSTVDDRLYISGVQLNEGPTCLPYSCPEYSTQMTQCTRFFYCINSAAGAYPHLGNGGANTTSVVYIEYHHPTEWYATLPTMTMIGSNWVIAGTAVNSYASEGDKKQITYRLTASGTPFTQYLCYLVYANNESTARVYMSSRL